MVQITKRWMFDLQYALGQKPTKLGSADVTVTFTHMPWGKVRNDYTKQINQEAGLVGADLAVVKSKPFAMFGAYMSALFDSQQSYTVHADFYRENQP